MFSTAVVSYHSSAVSEVSSLHKALRAGDFESFREEIHRDQTLLVKPNSVGWTALHICASNEISFDTWRWVLENVSSRHCNILDLRTDDGLTCVDIFFRTHLNPLNWQSHSIRQAARRLKAAMKKLLHDHEQLEVFGRHANDDEDVKEVPCFQEENSYEDLILVAHFWKRLLVLMKVLGQSDCGSLLHSLAITGCPNEVAKLAICLHPDQVSIRDAAGNLPIHLACKHERTKEILECLLPYHADSRDQEHDRLPLEIAIAQGKTWENGISRLWDAHPLYGAPRDVVTKLPAFLLAAVANQTVRAQETTYLAIENLRGMLRFMPSNSQKQALAEARKIVYLRHVSTIYEILRAAPHAIQC